MTSRGAGRLGGDVAVVTGATSGLGKEIARLFVAEAAVALVGRDRAHGEAAAAAAAGAADAAVG